MTWWIPAVMAPLAGGLAGWFWRESFLRGGARRALACAASLAVAFWLALGLPFDGSGAVVLIGVVAAGLAGMADAVHRPPRHPGEGSSRGDGTERGAQPGNAAASAPSA